MRQIRRRVAIAAVLALVVPAAAAAVATAKTVISMSGSTSVYPLAVNLAKSYNAHQSVGFRILQGGSDIGIDDVAHGRVTIGNASRDPEPGVDPHGLVFHKIARDGVCVITNPRNRVRGTRARSSRSSPAGSVTGSRYRDTASPERSTSSPAHPPREPRTRSRTSS